MKTTEMILPTWMASSLINGDMSGTNDEEEIKIDELQDYINEHNLGECVDVSSFYNRPPIDSILAYGETLGGDYSTYTFLSNG
jgi:hypothetical protein